MYYINENMEDISKEFNIDKTKAVLISNKIFNILEITHNTLFNLQIILSS